jgi:outer membrane lipoprotein-sorting protein
MTWLSAAMAALACVAAGIALLGWTQHDRELTSIQSRLKHMEDHHA